MKVLETELLTQELIMQIPEMQLQVHEVQLQVPELQLQVPESIMQVLEINLLKAQTIDGKPRRNSC